jgi:hypothetical protein
MASIKDDHKKRIAFLVVEAESNLKSFRYSDLCKICDYYFGEPRQKSTSHRVYKTPWAGDPRVNIQKGKGGKAKAYQVKQVIKAVEKKNGAKTSR